MDEKMSQPAPTRLWNKNFLLMWQGSLVSELGSVLYSVAIGYWVYSATGSSTLMGLPASIAMVMRFLLSAVCGAIADRADRKRIIVGMDLARGILMIAVGAVALAGRLSVPVVIAAAALGGMADVMFSPAVSTVFVDLVPASELTRAQSLSGSGTTVIDIIGKSISGLLVVAVGVPWLILFNGISFIISAVSEMFIDIPANVKQGQPISVSNIIGDMGRGLTAVRSSRVLYRTLFFALGINMLLSGFYSVMLVFCTQKGLDVQQYGLLSGIDSVGSLLGMVMVGLIKMDGRTRYRVAAISFFASIAATALISWAAGAAAIGLLLAASSFGNAIFNTIFNSAMFLMIPRDKRGLVIGFVMSGSIAGSAISTMIYGALGDVMSLGAVLPIASAIGIAISIPLFSDKDFRQVFADETQEQA